MCEHSQGAGVGIINEAEGLPERVGGRVKERWGQRQGWSKMHLSYCFIRRRSDAMDGLLSFGRAQRGVVEENRGALYRFIAVRLKFETLLRIQSLRSRLKRLNSVYLLLTNDNKMYAESPGEKRRMS